jgi:hypothetical protein
MNHGLILLPYLSGIGFLQRFRILQMLNLLLQKKLKSGMASNRRRTMALTGFLTLNLFKNVRMRQKRRSLMLVKAAQARQEK